MSARDGRRSPASSALAVPSTASDLRPWIARPSRRWARGAALASSGLLAASILLLPWYGLGAYEPNGWDATFWLRVALVLAALNLVTVRAGRRAAGSVPLAAATLALVALRVLLPPDFGFDFDGLDVPVERRAGAWVGLAAAAAALAAALAGRAPAAPPGRPAGGW